MRGGAGLVLVLCALVAGCGGEGEDRLPGELTAGFERKREEVDRYKRFPLYYLGKSYEGLALTHISYTRERWRPAGFVYGTCEPASTGLLLADGGCAPPLQLQVEPTCLRRRESLPGALRQTVRGVPAGPLEGSFALHTGAVLIKIYGRGRRQAAAALRPLRAAQPGGALPRPDPGPPRPCSYRGPPGGERP